MRLFLDIVQLLMTMIATVFFLIFFSILIGSHFIDIYQVMSFADTLDFAVKIVTPTIFLIGLKTLDKEVTSDKGFLYINNRLTTFLICIFASVLSYMVAMNGYQTEVSIKARICEVEKVTPTHFGELKKEECAKIFSTNLYQATLAKKTSDENGMPVVQLGSDGNPASITKDVK